MQKMKKTIESTGTEFLICFTSRPSSSSTSKTLMSPSHPSLSLSRRLRTSGSLKAGASSPMFPSSSSRRKYGAFIDAAAAEPSSPKVTCIGQVKIKAKKKSKSSKKRKIVINRSRSVSEPRLRKTVSICDALNCFVPSCGWSSCYYSTTTTTKREREHEVLRRDDKMGKFVGLVVRGEEEEVVERREEKVLVFEEKVEEEEKGMVSVCIPPRNALLLMRCRSDPVRMAALSSRFWDSPAMRIQCEDEVEVEEENDVDREKEEEVEVGEARLEKISLDDEDEEVEIGVVVDEDKNEAHVEEEEEEEEEEKIIVVDEVERDEEEEEVILAKPVKDVEEKEEETMLIEEKVEKEELKEEETMLIEEKVEKEELKEEGFCDEEGEEVEIVLRRSISCSAPKSQDLIKANEGGRRQSFSYREKKDKRRHSFSTEKEARRYSFCSEKEARRSNFSLDKEGRRRWSFSIEKENLGPKEKPIVVQSVELTKKEEPVKDVEPKIDEVSETIKVSKVKEPQVVGEREMKSRELPDCLLLMMYEPKLSMEVSKETWVCSTDFVHWCPHQANQPTKSKIEEKCEEVKNANANAVPIVEQTASKPVPTVSPIEQKVSKIVEQTASKPMQTVSPIEQKVPKNSAVGALPKVPYEQHFVLTRCKSEPVKSSARLVPDTCFWKSRHQPIGTAGIGF